MIFFKVINQQLIEVAFAGRRSTGQILSVALANKNSRYTNASIVRTLVQSSAQSQKVTNANNQQLIPVARNISFRQCQKSDIKKGQSSFSNYSASHFINANHESPYIIIDTEERRESPIEILKRKGKDVIEKRESELRSKYYNQSFNEAVATTTTATKKKLVVLLSWLEAKEKHIEKYRQFYLDRGFDVLNVKTSPLDLLLPSFGSQKISKDFVRFMVDKQYSNVLLHGFSVGGYMFGRFLLEIDQHDQQVRNKLLNSIQGIVFDSLVAFEGTCIGVSRSITSNPIAAKIIEYILRLYLVVGHKIATKYYLEANDKVWGGPLKCPTLFLMSKDDMISDHRIVEKLASVWSSKGVDCYKMLVDSSPHVQLYTQHHDKYVKEVDNFLKQIKLAE